MIRQKKDFRPLFRAAIAVYVVFGLGMLFGTFFDLQVDKALFHYSNAWGKFMERFGMFPESAVRFGAWTALAVYLPFPKEALDWLAGFIPAAVSLKEKHWAVIGLGVLRTGAFAGFIYLAFLGSDEMLSFIIRTATAYGNLQDLFIGAGMTKWLAVLLWSLARIVPVVLLAVLFAKLPKDVGRVILLLAVVGLLMRKSADIIWYLKVHFNRVRFREMIAYAHGLIDQNGWSHRGSADLPREWIADTDFSSYAPWYKVGDAMGRYSDPTSFPSGHTTASSYTFLLIPLFGAHEKLKKYFVPAVIVGAGYVLNMGVSRLVRGAHYLTDISSAALIMFTVMLFWFAAVYAAVRLLEALRERAKTKRERKQ